MINKKGAYSSNPADACTRWLFHEALRVAERVLFSENKHLYRQILILSMHVMLCYNTDIKF